MVEDFARCVDRTEAALRRLSPGATVVLYQARLSGGPMDDRLGMGAVLAGEAVKITAEVVTGTFKRTPAGFTQVAPWRHPPKTAGHLAANWASTERDAVMLKEATVRASIEHMQRLIEERKRGLTALASWTEGAGSGG